jgi:hypothetical protein
MFNLQGTAVSNSCSSKKKTSKGAPKPSPKCQKYPPRDYWSGLENSYFFFPFFQVLTSSLFEGIFGIWARALALLLKFFFTVAGVTD